MTQDLVQPNEYPVPEEDQERLDFATKAISSAGIIFLLMLGVSLYAAFVSEDTGGIWAMAGVTAVTGGILGYSLWYYFDNAHFTYEAHGVTLDFSSAQYYVPPKHMEALVSAVKTTWATMDVDVDDLYRQVVLSVLDHRPRDPANRVDPDRVVGLTYHSRKASQVWGPYALSAGGAGYELMLHGAEARWPGSDEPTKIERMKKHGLLRQLRSEYAQNLERVV